MTQVLGDRRTLVWLVLVAATVLTATLGLEQHGSDVVGVVLLCIAFVKVRLVALHFMEIREAPTALRLIVEAYVVVTLGTLTALYLVA